MCGQFTIQVADKDAYPEEVPGPIIVNVFLYSVKRMRYIEAFWLQGSCSIHFLILYYRFRGGMQLLYVGVALLLR